MHAVRLCLVSAAALALSGCLNSSTLIKVKPDGAGTIEQTILMNTATLKGLLAGLDAQGQIKATNPFTEAEFQKMAAALGKGVRFVSSTPMAEGGFEGAKAIFAFDDVSAIRIQENPDLATPMGGRVSMPSSAPVRFSFAREGQNSVLTVAFDEKSLTQPSADPKPLPTLDPAMLGMMKTLFAGFKVAIDLEVEGKIVKTNADYVNGSRITLLELELAGLLEDEAKLRDLQSKVGASLAEIRPFLKDVKGVKLNHPVVTIEYR